MISNGFPGSIALLYVTHITVRCEGFALTFESLVAQYSAKGIRGGRVNIAVPKGRALADRFGTFLQLESQSRMACVRERFISGVVGFLQASSRKSPPCSSSEWH